MASCTRNTLLNAPWLTKRLQENGQTFWLPGRQFQKFLEGQYLQREYERRLEEAVTLARQLQIQVSQLEEENEELESERDTRDKHDPDHFVEVISLLTTQFMHSVLEAEARNDVSWQQKAIIERLKSLIGRHYPEQDFESFLQTGQIFLNCISPPPSPEVLGARTLEAGPDESMKGTGEDENKANRKSSSSKELDEMMFGLSKKESKRTIRE